MARYYWAMFYPIFMTADSVPILACRFCIETPSPQEAQVFSVTACLTFREEPAVWGLVHEQNLLMAICL